MAMNRIDALTSLLEQSPTDIFARYALAMEYVKADRDEDAVREFHEIQRIKPDYAAAYFHAGQALERLDRTDEARDSYRKGIEVTARSGDKHAQSELQAALDILG